jgi:repressor LexA
MIGDEVVISQSSPSKKDFGLGRGARPASLPMPLTAPQAAILQFIIDIIARTGQAPTVREIGRHFGIASVNGVISHLRALERRGYIRREARVPRGIVVLRSG